MSLIQEGEHQFDVRNICLESGGTFPVSDISTPLTEIISAEGQDVVRRAEGSRQPGALRGNNLSRRVAGRWWNKNGR